MLYCDLFRHLPLLSFTIIRSIHWISGFQGHNVFVSHIHFPLQASFVCTPGYSEPALPWPSHLLGGHLPGLLLPEQTEGHLLQRQFGTKPRRHWRPAAERLRAQVRTGPPCHLYLTALLQFQQQIYAQSIQFNILLTF